MKYTDYPWHKRFPVQEADYKQWESEKSGSSLLLWALENKIVDRDKYFEWAIEHYQLPLLESHFFEYVVMGKDQWKRVKDLKEWGREILPVWEWENMAYIGCMEPPQDYETWDFPHRLVLVKDIALKMQWKFIKDFSDLLPKADSQYTQKASVKSFFSDFLSKKSAKKQEEAPQSKPAAVQNLFPDEETRQPSFDPMGEPVRETSPMEITDNPQRNNILSMNQFKASSPQQKQQQQKPPTFTVTNTAVLERKTGVIQIKEQDFFSSMEEQTKPFFAGILLLQNKNNLLFPVKWGGRIQIPNESAPLISLTDNSIFSVLIKGFDYHGFIVENEINKKFFKDISWSFLPKHITAIPIPGPKKKAERIFLGIATKSLPYETLDDIKKMVLPFFKETSQKQAA